MKQSYKTIALWLAMLLIFVGAFKLMGGHKQSALDVPFSTFVGELETDKIAELTFKGEQKIQGKYKPDYKEGRDFSSFS